MSRDYPNLVEQLRKLNKHDTHYNLRLEAADEIERLRTEVELWKDRWQSADEIVKAMDGKLKD